MTNNQAFQTLESMKNVLRQMRQQELNNAEIAQELSASENSNQNLLSNSGVPQLQSMAAKEGMAASALNQFNAAESRAASQLSQLEQMVSELENQLS